MEVPTAQRVLRVLKITRAALPLMLASEQGVASAASRRTAEVHCTVIVIVMDCHSFSKLQLRNC